MAIEVVDGSRKAGVACTGQRTGETKSGRRRFVGMVYVVGSVLQGQRLVEWWQCRVQV